MRDNRAIARPARVLDDAAAHGAHVWRAVPRGMARGRERPSMRTASKAVVVIIVLVDVLLEALIVVLIAGRVATTVVLIVREAERAGLAIVRLSRTLASGRNGLLKKKAG